LTIKEKIKRMSDRARRRPRAILLIEGDEIMTEEKLSFKERIFPNWIDDIAEGITSTVRFKGELITSPKIKCSACNTTIDVNREVDFQTGSKLASAKHDFEDFIKFIKTYIEVQEKARNGKLTLDNYIEEQEKLNVELTNNAMRYDRSTVQSGPVYIICPKCGSSIGDVVVELSRKSFNVSALTLEELDKLPLSPTMAARITHDWRFPDIGTLEEWRSFKDIERTKVLINEFKEKLAKITSPDIVNILSDFASTIDRALTSLDNEMWLRRRHLKDAIIKIIQSRKSQGDRVAG